MKPMVKALIAAGSLLSLAHIPLSTAIGAECMRIASPPANMGMIAVLTPGVKKAFETAGLCFENLNMPVKRAQKEMMDGTIDGEYIRVKSYITAMKDHVVAVPTPLLEMTGHIVSLKAGGFTPNSLAEIQDKKIGLVLGVKWHEIMGKHIRNTTVTKRFETLGKQLMAGRVDGFLIETASLNRLFATGIMKKEAVHISKPIADLSGYILLHKKNASLVGKLDEALKKVKAAGGFKM